MVRSLCKLFCNILMEEEEFFKGPVYILCIFSVKFIILYMDFYVFVRVYVLCRSCLIQKIVNRGKRRFLVMTKLLN